jgi:hypothetical protein
MRVVSATYDLETSTIPEVQKQILDVLEHDGYLTRRLDHYEFVSKLLRDWWKARHGFGYTPTSQRGA